MHDFQEQCQVHGQRSKNMASRFASSTQQEIEKLFEDKDSENTKRSTASRLVNNLYVPRAMHDFQEQCQVHGQRSKNMASRFASSTQQEIEKLFEDKDSENTKRSTKVAKELFYEYLKEKNIQEPHDKKELRKC